MALRLFGILSVFVAISVLFSFSIICAVAQADDEGNKPNILFIPVGKFVPCNNNGMCLVLYRV